MTREQTAVTLGRIYRACCDAAAGTPRAAAVQRLGSRYFRAPVQTLNKLRLAIGGEFPPRAVQLLNKLDPADLEAMDAPGRPLPGALQGRAIMGYYTGTAGDD